MFAIADDGCIKVEFDEQIVPTKIVQKGDKIAIGKKAPKNKWMYKISFNDEDEFIESLEKMITLLYKYKEYIDYLKTIYEEVKVTIYIRSDYAEIGFSLSSDIIKKMSLLGCTFNLKYYHLGWQKNNVKVITEKLN